MKKTVTLNIGREIEMLTGPMLTAEGKVMTVRDLLLQRIPIGAGRDTNHTMRLWNIGLEMDKAKTTFTMTELDFELLKKSIFESELQVWAQRALDRVFNEAKRE